MWLRDAYRALFQCKVCLRVNLSVFAAILAIECVILVPSALKYRTDAFKEREQLARNAADSTLSGLIRFGGRGYPMASVPALMVGNARIVGVRLISANCGLIGQAGDIPSIPMDCRPHKAFDDGMFGHLRYQAMHPDLGFVDVKFATSDIMGELLWYILRIAGLVALISMVVTATAALVLRKLVFVPVVRLHDALERAGSSQAPFQSYRVPIVGSGELAEMSGMFNVLMARLDAAMNDIKEREEQLRLLNATLESRVEERTADLAGAIQVAERSSRAKSDFLANMSHELRTPLNAIIGFSDIMGQEMFGPLGSKKYKSYVGDINASSKHLLDIVEDILKMTGDGEAADLELAEGGALEMVRHAVSALNGADNSRVRVQEAGFHGVRLKTDLRKVDETLRRLLSNGLKYAEPSLETPLVISGERTATGGFAICVQDRGPGMTPEQIDVAMQPFGQTASVYARKQGGAGLGLPLANLSAKAMGARLVLAPGDGGGLRAMLQFDKSTMTAEAADAGVSVPKSMRRS